MDDKIQTGLRIPRARHEEMTALADEAGMSLNAQALLLINMGLSVIRRGTQEEVRLLLHTLRDNGE